MGEGKRFMKVLIRIRKKKEGGKGVRRKMRMRWVGGMIRNSKQSNMIIVTNGSLNYLKLWADESSHLQYFSSPKLRE